MPYKDGRKEDWFKYERIKIFQDEQGKAVQANFAVTDTLKNKDKPNDHHSSKNICLPLNPGALMSLLDKTPITPDTKEIRLLIKAEPRFSPQTDIDISSLRFGASSEMNFGKGCKPVRTEKSGKDLIVIFSDEENGITSEEFAPKLLGKKKDGELIFGCCRLPWMDYTEPILSARKPKVVTKDGKQYVSVIVENFGLKTSAPTQTQIQAVASKGAKSIVIATAQLLEMKPYDKQIIGLCPSDSWIDNDDRTLTIRFVR